MEFPQKHYLCNMSEFGNRVERKKERKEKDKTRRDKLAGYFFDLSKLSFAGLVISVVSPLFTDVEDVKSWGVAVFGVAITSATAMLANKILK